MFHSARTSARAMLVAAGTAGFVALGAGIAGADTLGGVTDGLPLGDLDQQVPASLTEGVATPVGDLVKVEPGQISAQPEVQHQSGPADTVGHVIGDGVSAQAPIETGDDNSAEVGPLDLGGASETLPLSGGGVDPVSGLLGGAGLLDALSLDGGQTLPLGHPESPLPLESHASVVDDTVGELGGRVESGIQETSPHLVTLDEVRLDRVGETVPMSDPVGLDAGENADLTGGVTTLLPADVQETLAMSGPADLVPAVESVDAGPVGEATDTVESLDLPLPLDGSGVGEDTLPQTAATDLVGDLLPQTAGGDLIDVQGLPELGEPEFAGDELPVGDGSDLDLGLI
ncbi:hypothetical protein [Nocardiopsis sp. MG754419]|uniref:hypothetical protein n=1 Tax=Nocardiopsis sp. MG754419 TaxID=2259865 RepID=UPI001BA6C41B|nr:hypothetical protein [Nocardiopsis sp. MG754419]MBR8742244.1 hypothetical protein [Nocardiopsis sp. MG754419]